jgi:hypothetical protein
MVAGMPLSDSSDTLLAQTDVPVCLILTVEAYDLIAQSKGKRTRADQARWHGIARSTLQRLLAGDTPSAKNAQKIAADLGLRYEQVWGAAA